MRPPLQQPSRRLGRIAVPRRSGGRLALLGWGLALYGCPPAEQVIGPATDDPAGVRLAIEPAGVAAGAALAPALRVEVRDFADALVGSASIEVTLSLGESPVGATLAGTLVRATIAGVATFDDVVLTRAGPGYTLIASAPGLPADTSAAFVVAPGPADSVAFCDEPSSAPAGEPISPAVQVCVHDAFDNLADTYAGQVTVALHANPAAGDLLGVKTRSAAGGMALFDDLSIERAGAGYALVATSGALAQAVSGSFVIAPAAAVALSFSVPPSDVVAGEPIEPSVEVSLLDVYGNLVTVDARPVSVDLYRSQGGAGTSGGAAASPATLGGTTTVVASGGVARFEGLQLSSPGGSYRLVTTAAELSPDTSTAFAVLPADEPTSAPPDAR